MEGFVDSSDSYVNVMIITRGRYRITTFKQTIERYNASKLSDSSKVIIRAQSQFDDEIMSLSRLEGAKRDKHGFYRRILEAKTQKNPSYFQWPSNDEQKKNRNLNKELHIDMIRPFISSEKRKSRVPLRYEQHESIVVDPSGKLKTFVSVNSLGKVIYF